MSGSAQEMSCRGHLCELVVMEDQRLKSCRTQEHHLHLLSHGMFAGDNLFGDNLFE